MQITTSFWVDVVAGGSKKLLNLCSVVVSAPEHHGLWKEEKEAKKFMCRRPEVP